MKKKNEIELIYLSKYRLSLMGLSIILIMLFHCGFCSFGFIGVELFLAMSAMGLHFSLSKDGNLKRFYKKRIFRILPSYFMVSIPVLFFHFLEGDISIEQAAKLLFQISVIRKESSFLWFISIIMICYLITPIFFYHKKALLSKQSLIIITIFCYTFGSFCLPKIIIERIPLFLISLKFSSWVFNNKRISCNAYYILLILTIIFTYFIVEDYFNFPMYNDYLLASIAAFPFLIFTTILLLSSNLKIIKFLNYLGTITLEIYLLHELVCIPLLKYIMMGTPSFFINLTSIPLAIFLASILHQIVTISNRKRN